MIHSTALIHPNAKLGKNISIGAYSIIEENVEIGDGCSIGPHVVIKGHTRLGKNNRVFQFACLGEIPQDKKYANEVTYLEIGDANTIREFCTFNCGTVQDGGTTRIGSNNWIMAYVHIAHDCQIGNNTIFANNTTLAGHVHVGDYAILGGFTAVHQFVHIGAHPFTGVATVLLQDLPPYVVVGGHETKPHGINSEGLKRRGFSSDTIMAIKRAYKTLYRSGYKLEEAKQHLLEQSKEAPEIKIIVDFLATATRGIIR